MRSKDRPSSRQRLVALVAFGVIIISVSYTVMTFMLQGSSDVCIVDPRIAAWLQMLVKADAGSNAMPNEEAFARVLDWGDGSLRVDLDELGIAIAVNPLWDRLGKEPVPAAVAYSNDDPCRHWVDGRGVVTVDKNPIPPGWSVAHDPNR